MKSIPAFPDSPAPEPCSLTDFIEGTGANALLVEAVKKLFEVPNKPENPIEWFRLYFNRLLSETIKTGDKEETDLDDVEAKLKTELMEMESKLLSAFETEALNKDIIGKFEHELENVRMTSTKNYQRDNFRTYRNNLDDYHYRIRPDPCYQPSKSDLLLSDDEGAGGDTKMKDSLPPVDLRMVPAGKSKKLRQVDEVYKDYPRLYFPTGEEEEADSEPVPDESDAVEESVVSSGVDEELENDVSNNGDDNRKHDADDDGDNNSDFRESSTGE